MDRWAVLKKLRGDPDLSTTPLIFTSMLDDAPREWDLGIVGWLTKPVAPEEARLEAIINPTLIVEVLSESTDKYDRGERFAHYLRIASVEEYVLVSQEERRIEVFRRPERGHWTFDVAKEGQTLTLHGRAISVDAVYG